MLAALPISSHSVNVVERQKADQRVLRGELDHVVASELGDVGNQVVLCARSRFSAANTEACASVTSTYVSEHDALGKASGPRGVRQGHNILLGVDLNLGELGAIVVEEAGEWCGLAARVR